jgi:Ca2+/Na+ antiporter
MKIKNPFTTLNTLGKDESIENIIKSVIISLLIGISITLIFGWFDCRSRTFYDISDSYGNRVERIEYSFNYGTGLIFGSISTLFIFIRRLLASKNS